MALFPFSRDHIWPYFPSQGTIYGLIPLLKGPYTALFPFSRDHIWPYSPSQGTIYIMALFLFSRDHIWPYSPSQGTIYGLIPLLKGPYMALFPFSRDHIWPYSPSQGTIYGLIPLLKEPYMALFPFSCFNKLLISSAAPSMGHLRFPSARKTLSQIPILFIEMIEVM